jgi:uncharacterized protein
MRSASARGVAKMYIYEALAFALSAPLIGSGRSYSADTAEDWREQLQQWRAENSTALTAPDGPLSLVGLELLKPGDNSVGAALDNDIRLPSAGKAHVAVIRVEGDNIQLKSPRGGFPSELAVDGRAPREQAIVFDGSAPTKFTVGTLTFFVIRRGESNLLRIKDTLAPTLLNFKGQLWYPPDAHYRIESEWVPLAQPKAETIHSIIGTSTKIWVPGFAKFTLHGETVELEPLTQEDRKTLLFVIRDETSGDTTFANARFLYTGPPDHGLSAPGKLVLDFNRLENPPCAYTPYSTCPLPPESNRLKISIFAGALRYAPSSE